MEKFKNMFLNILNFIFGILVFIGYFAGLDFLCEHENIDKRIGLLIGIIIACISFYTRQKESEEEAIKNEREQKEVLNLVKLLYETDYNNLKSISGIVLSNTWLETVIISLKNGFKIGLNLNDISWIKDEEDIQSLDEYIINNPQKTEMEYVLLLMNIKYESH